MTEQEIERAGSTRAAWTLALGVFTLLLAVLAFFLPEVEWMPRGGLVGWTLLFAGAVEFGLGCKRGLDPVGKAHAGSGFITALAGLLLVTNPTPEYFPVANVVMVWLLLRGAWVVVTGLAARLLSVGPWLFLSGAADVLLGIALFAGLQVTVLVILLFGPTDEIVARFSLILAISFAITGLGHIATAIVERRRVRPDNGTT